MRKIKNIHCYLKGLHNILCHNNVAAIIKLCLLIAALYQRAAVIKNLPSKLLLTGNSIKKIHFIVPCNSWLHSFFVHNINNPARTLFTYPPLTDIRITNC